MIQERLYPNHKKKKMVYKVLCIGIVKCDKR